LKLKEKKRASGGGVDLKGSFRKNEGKEGGEGAHSLHKKQSPTPSKEVRIREAGKARDSNQKSFRRGKEKIISAGNTFAFMKRMSWGTGLRGGRGMAKVGVEETRVGKRGSKLVKKRKDIESPEVAVRARPGGSAILWMMSRREKKKE